MEKAQAEQDERSVSRLGKLVKRGSFVGYEEIRNEKDRTGKQGGVRGNVGKGWMEKKGMRFLCF